jgi:glucose-1-phosphate cytidylyltransferase
MKVVLFCGGMGMRLREYSESLPKPLVTIGYRPILWNLMSYYAHYGHKDFILALGYRADAIKNYFLNYDEALSNDFVMEAGGRKVELLNRDIDDWRITFVDTGLHANIGERLLAVRPHLEGEEMFMANYGDALTDLPLDRYLEWFEGHDKAAGFLSVAAPHTFHIVDLAPDGTLKKIEHVGKSSVVRINGGFFAFRTRLFDYLQPGEELVEEPFERMIVDQQVAGYRYDGFWAAMDTLKDKTRFDELWAAGDCPWEVWKRRG